MKMLNNYKEMLNNLSNNYLANLNDDVMIIDALNLFIRVYGAVPTLNDDGEHVGGVTGFLLSLGALIRQQKPSRVIVVFDGKGGSNQRKKLYPDYKSGRSGLTKLNRLAGYEDLEDSDASMKRQFQILLNYLQLLPITVCYIDYIEADDVIAYMANHVFTKKVTIVSTDMDFLQLVNDRIQVYSPSKKIMFTPENVIDVYGIRPDNIIYYRIIEGDKSDNIKGVSGIGKKTIQNKITFLSENINGFDDFISKIETIDTKIKDKLLSSKSILEMNYNLMQLSNPTIPASITSNIRNIVETDITQFNPFLFKKQFMVDKLYTAFNNIESWLGSTWNELETYAKQSRK
jgi:5'-3' exonuclease